MLHRLAFVLLLTWCLQPHRVGAELCDPADSNLLKPDLKALPPTQVRVLNWGATRRLFFTTTIGNVGDGPLIIRGETVHDPNGTFTRAWQRIERRDGTVCEVEAGQFEFHPLHLHWHFDDFADYILRKDDPFTGEIVARSEKVSFCLLDITRVPGVTPGRQRFITTCASQQGVQGISVGYADVYDSGLPGQYIELETDPANPLPPGNYFLVNVANPDKILWEKDDDAAANSGVVSVTIPSPRGYGTPRPTATPRMTSTPTASATATASATPPPTDTPRLLRPTRLPRPDRAPRPPRAPHPGGPHSH